MKWIKLIPKRRHLFNQGLRLVCLIWILGVIWKINLMVFTEQVTGRQEMGNNYHDYRSRYTTSTAPLMKNFKVEGNTTYVMYTPPGHAKSLPSPDLPLKVPNELWQDFWNVPLYITITNHTVREYVFVTAADDFFYLRSLRAIVTVQRHFPNATIVYYDLGLKPSRMEQLTSICGVVYRKFNFTKYPAHVSYLKYYAWKPIIIYETLTTYPAVFWIDTSVRFHSDLGESLHNEILKSQLGVMFFSKTGHSTFAATHPGTFTYLATDMAVMKKAEQRESIVLLYRTRGVYEHILQWLYVCALTKECIAPEGNNLYCDFSDDRFGEYGNCHRFDQSVLNIMVANYLNFHHFNETYTEGILEVSRAYKHKDRPQREVIMCRVLL